MQQAARELIGAARSFLDAAEELVEDSEFVEEATTVVRSFAEELGSFTRDRVPPEGGEDPDSTATKGADNTTARGNASRSTRVRRIDVE